MNGDERTRQAHVHNLMTAAESLPAEGGAPYLQPYIQGGEHSKSKSNSHSPHSHGSPSHSSNNGAHRAQQRKPREKPAVNAAGASGTEAPSDLSSVNLQFKKESIMVSPADRPSSTLAQQLQLARSALDDSNFPRSSSHAVHRYTVYLPHEEGSMVQIEVNANCTAHQLVKQAIGMAKEENGGDLPVGLVDDPWEYRCYVAEEDGEVDTDFPVLDVRLNINTLGVDAFVLRDRVDAALALPRPSIVEGPGEDHSISGKAKAGKGFSSLETEQENKLEGMGSTTQNESKCCCTIQ